MPGTTPVVNDLLQLRVNCQAASQLSQNVTHWVVTSTVGGGMSLGQLADAMFIHFRDVYKAWMPVTAFYNGVSLQNVTPPRTDPFEGAGAAGAGGAIGNLEPRQASGLIRTLTGLGGRANRGRIYIGFLASSSVDASGELDAGGFALITGIANAYGPSITYTLGPLQTQVQLTVRHPDTLPPARVPVFTQVTSIQPQLLIATQRRRGDYGRQNF